MQGRSTSLNHLGAELGPCGQIAERIQRPSSVPEPADGIAMCVAAYSQYVRTLCAAAAMAQQRVGQCGYTAASLVFLCASPIWERH